MEKIRFAILGGSGLYQMEGLQDVTEQLIPTPFGNPSDAIAIGTLDGVRVAFLARHGRNHSVLPSEIPFRANIWALKSLGVEYLISVSAVGSLKEHLAPRQMVLPDQFIDLTRQRAGTFFGDGAVAHISLARPVCAALSDVLADAFADASLADVTLQRGGTYVCIEGPAFSTLAESRLYRSWDADIIGMTNMPEARLAREAEIAYATLALVTDFDCWHPGHEAVTAEMAIGNLTHNAAGAQAILRAALRRLGANAPVSAAHTALAQSLVTQPAAMPQATRDKLAPLLEKYL
ncbi:5'-methylthioadenosine phosphorylase [Actimicrobium sp. GrIS 1.19]|uniref:S-methyl-5'-thioadenosine phosphorylase n=1 Tax=Actimicrobium sp. GrIS 1.19 TaxID=3071708 RepID=UPI002E077A2D|nr:5'-methylthioadenosine phosphorylase [Actimicrobium sp. GrIS 1.19]